MKRFLAGVAVFSVLCSASGFSQSSLPLPDSIPTPILFPGKLDFTGSGARAAGMGGAFLAVSDDISAVSWNPAGLSKFQSPVFGLSLSTFAPRGEFQFNNNIAKQTPSFSDLGLLSLIAPVRIKGHHVVMSLSISRVDDEFNSAFFRDSLPFDSDGGGNNFSPTNITFAQDVSYESGLQVINFGFGTDIGTNLSVGGAFNIYTGRSETRNITIIDLPNVQFIDIDPSGLQENDIINSFFTLDSTKYSGINFTVGFKYNKPKFSVGIIARSPFSLELETDRREERLLFANGVPVKTDTLLSDNNVFEMDMPLMIGGGIAFRPTNNVTLAVDGEYRSFSGNVGRRRDLLILVPGSETIEEFTEIPLNFRNVFTIRAGGEYNWSTGSALFPVVPIRAGFASVPIAALDNTSAISFSVGSGIRWEQIHLDVAYVRTTFDFDGSLDTFSGQSLPFNSESKDNQFKLTFTGFF